MSESTVERPTRRRYGNIIAPPKTGFFGLPEGVSRLAVATILAAFLGQLGLSMIPGVGAYSEWVAGGIVLVGGFECIRRMRKGAFGRFRYQEKALKKNYLKAVKNGWTKYRPGPSGTLPDGSYRLPGPLAGTRADDYADSFGQEFGMIWDGTRRTGTIMFSVAAPGQQLFDQADIDKMVSEWALVQSEAGLASSIVQIVASVITTQDTGQRLPLAQQAHRQLAGDQPVPDVARAVMDEVREIENRAIPKVEHVVALSFSGQASREEGLPARTREQVAEEISSVADGFKRIIEAASAGSTRLMKAQDMTDYVYVAFNPAQAAAVEQTRIIHGREGTGLRWEEAGPTYADVHKDYYEHSNRFSKTFQQWKPPAALFQEDSLRTLLEPDLGIERKCVSLLYRPQTPDKSQEEALQAVLDADYDTKQRGRKATSVSKTTKMKAEHTEKELANGAVLVPFSMMVTITTDDPARFPRMVAETKRKASTGVHIGIREATYTHDSAFGLALGLGLVPNDFQMKGM